MSRGELVLAAAVLARAGLVDAFGHVSARDGDAALITAARPLGGLTGADLRTLPLDASDPLPAGVPKEAWIHLAVYRDRPDAGAVCRAQPPAALAVAAVAGTLPALHGQAVLAGAPAPVFDDARLIRDPERAAAAAARLGEGHALILRGNGAVTVGATVGRAVARMVLLERAARVFLAAAAAGTPRALTGDEVAHWRAAAEELLDRYWAFLTS